MSVCNGTGRPGAAPDLWGPTISARDNATGVLRELIVHPGRLLSMGLFVIRFRESNNVVTVIDLLETAQSESV